VKQKSDHAAACLQHWLYNATNMLYVTHHHRQLQHNMNLMMLCLQAHFQRTNLSGDLATDQAKVLTLATRLLQACVDVVSTNSWLNPAIAAMEMSQMVIQAMWQTDPVLLQLPHFTRDLAKKCAQANITTIIASQEEGSSLADMEVGMLCMLCFDNAGCAVLWQPVLCCACCALMTGGVLCFDSTLAQRMLRLGSCSCCNAVSQCYSLSIIVSKQL
jgi:hypothetical protein